jgi:ligand-binding SRPBCC domain-containing protein
MEKIRLATWIDAPVERCFLLSLSIDLHAAAAGRKELDAVLDGLVGEGETITFQRAFFGLQQHTTRIEALRPYSYFRDVMVSGPFKYFEHDHHFAAMDDGTRVRDEIRFSAPWGPLGRILARRRLAAFLNERSAVIKRVAESNEWRQYLESDMEDGPPGASIKTDPEAGWEKNSILRSSQEIVVPRPPHA